MKWYRKAADQGHAQAQTILGLMYRQGQGVMQDIAEAMKWFRKAAEQGDAVTQNILREMYNEGPGVTKDDVKTLMLVNLATARGNDRSAKAHNIVAAQMTPADISKAERFARECAENNYKNCGF